jgi:SulP family sulfate permease
MIAALGAKANLERVFEPIPHYLKRPARLLGSYDRESLRPDLIAGITVAVILLPQAIAFAIVAELPAQMGLYTAVVAAILGAFWGSSNQVHTGPANAISLIILSSLQNTGITDSGQMVLAAGLMAVMVGIFQLIMGLARLGILINFVSHSVVVGFSTGAGVLIALKQISPLLNLSFPGRDLVGTVSGIARSLDTTHVPTAALGIGTMALILILRRVNPRLPGALIGMIMSSIIVYVGRLHESGVDVIGQLPRGLPPLANLPLLDVELIGRLSSGALAVGAIGLVETMAIARSIATQTGQRLDSNQEFVGQGMANLAAGLFSGFPGAASFSRSAVNFEAGARSPMSAVFSSLFVLIAMLILAPLAAFLPLTALAGVLIVTAYGMIDQEEIRRIWQGTRGDAIIMLVTFWGTLFLEIEFAVLLGILFSFARYIMRTSVPRVHEVKPDSSYKHFEYQPEKVGCPQLGIIDILGDLYFGAVNHVEEVILDMVEHYEHPRHLLIRMHRVNHCDFSGIHMLESVTRALRDSGGDLFLVQAGYSVRKVMASTGFDTHLHPDHFLPADEAISYLFYRVLDPAICIYECPVRVFKECQNLPKRNDVQSIPLYDEVPVGQIADVLPAELWQQLCEPDQFGLPYVVDVREPREYRRGHIPDAVLVPLPSILSDEVKFPNNRHIVLVCRSGRRSRRAAYALHRIGCTNVVTLRGGMLAWAAAGLLEAIGSD